MRTRRNTDQAAPAPADERLFVRPVEGRLVRHPRTMRPIPEEGADVTSDRGYFHRMIRAGDVTVAPRPTGGVQRESKRNPDDEKGDTE
jgi:hypothetical protein